MRKKKKKGSCRGPKTEQSRHERAQGTSKTLGSLRQLHYNKAFRIPRPMWSEELLKAIEKEAETESHIQTKPAPKTETKDLLLLVADIATGLWRIDKKTTIDDTSQTQDSVRSIRRHVESTLDALTTAKVEIRDHTGEKYVTGMALRVIAFQPTRSVRIEKVSETIKPSVFYKDKLIQRGEVIVETPETEHSDQALVKEAASDATSSSKDRKWTQNDGEEPGASNNT